MLVIHTVLRKCVCGRVLVIHTVMVVGRGVMGGCYSHNEWGEGGALVKHIKVDWALATHRVKGALCSQSDWKRWGRAPVVHNVMN